MSPVGSDPSLAPLSKSSSAMKLDACGRNCVITCGILGGLFWHQHLMFYNINAQGAGTVSSYVSLKPSYPINIGSYPFAF